MTPFPRRPWSPRAFAPRFGRGHRRPLASVPQRVMLASVVPEPWRECMRTYVGRTACAGRVCATTYVGVTALLTYRASRPQYSAYPWAFALSAPTTLQSASLEDVAAAARTLTMPHCVLVFAVSARASFIGTFANRVRPQPDVACNVQPHWSRSSGPLCSIERVLGGGVGVGRARTCLLVRP